MLVKSKSNVFINVTKLRLAVLFLLYFYLQMKTELIDMTV